MPLTLIAVLLIVVILAAVIVYVTRPLFTMQDETDEEAVNNKSDQFESEYKDILERIRELDFDFSLGKMTEEEHKIERDELLARAAVLRNQLKAGDTQTPPSA